MDGHFICNSNTKILHIFLSEAFEKTMNYWLSDGDSWV